jgi:hypothetical protein
VEKVKVGVFKCGNIGTSPLFELLLDELADRQDVKIRTVTTGSKMGVEDVEEALPKIFEFNPDLLVSISPNPSISGPAKVREKLSQSGVPSVVISDAPGKRVKAELEKQGLGYIIITGDPLIGARREFLDPIEMSLFNADVIRVLSVTGAFRVVFEETDKAIEGVKSGKPYLPRVIVDRDKAVGAAIMEKVLLAFLLVGLVVFGGALLIVFSAGNMKFAVGKEPVFDYKKRQFSLGDTEFTLDVPSNWREEIGRGMFGGNITLRGQYISFVVKHLEDPDIVGYVAPVPYDMQNCPEKAVSWSEWNKSLHDTALLEYGREYMNIMVKNCCADGIELICNSSATNGFEICERIFQSFNCG